jgi:hypothetical protein
VAAHRQTPEPNPNRGTAVDPMLQEALDYAECRLAVFPVNGKVPFKHSHGVKDASTDPHRIREMWAAHPGANIAIACGAPSQIIAIDDDNRIEFQNYSRFECTILKFSTRNRLPLSFLSFVGSVSETHHDLSMRDNNHPMIRSYGSRLLR